MKDVNEMFPNEVDDILAMLDASEYPETYEMLTDVYDGGKVKCSAYELATAFTSCDNTVPMKPFVFNFVVKLLDFEIRNGNVSAMNDLGALYYDGRGCGQDFSKAVEYYTMAAENGDSQAQENLGYCYYYGRVGEPDYEKAFRYFSMGAFTGRLTSLYKIGDMYKNGYFVEKNETEAFRIWDRCMALMTEDEDIRICAGPVLLRIGDAFLKGEGTEADAKKALVCYQKAETFLYDMLIDGDGMYRKSYESAVEGQSKARELLKKTLPDPWEIKD